MAVIEEASPSPPSSPRFSASTTTTSQAAPPLHRRTTPPKPSKQQAPFLAQKRWKAAGSPAPPHPFLRQAFLWTWVAFISSMLLSRTVTESYFWGKDAEVQRTFNGYRQTVITSLIGSPKPTVMSVAQLAKHDGTDDKYPVYIAIDGKIYDVSAGKQTYGPGGSYHFFAGKDASRAYVTGCFNEHLTNDLRGLTEKELSALDHWRKFFANSEKYSYVGLLSSPPIDPKSPIPPPCR